MRYTEDAKPEEIAAGLGKTGSRHLWMRIAGSAGLLLAVPDYNLDPMRHLLILSALLAGFVINAAAAEKKVVDIKDAKGQAVGTRPL